MGAAVGEQVDREHDVISLRANLAPGLDPLRSRQGAHEEDEARDARDSYDGRKRRWVIYRGYAEASKVPAEWHGWLHHTFDEPPTIEPLKRRSWEKDYVPNLTGTTEAWRPTGSLARSPSSR